VRPVRRGEGLSDSPSGWRCAWTNSMAAKAHRAGARVSQCGAAADLLLSTGLGSIGATALFRVKRRRRSAAGPERKYFVVRRYRNSRRTLPRVLSLRSAQHWTGIRNRHSLVRLL
jgi:hypothetical protein